MLIKQPLKLSRMYIQYPLLAYRLHLLKNVETSLLKQQSKLLNRFYKVTISLFVLFCLCYRLTKINTILFGSLYAFSQSFIYFATSAAISIGAIIFTKNSDSVFHADLVDIFQLVYKNSVIVYFFMY